MLSFAFKLRLVIANSHLYSAIKRGQMTPHEGQSLNKQIKSCWQLSTLSSHMAFTKTEHNKQLGETSTNTPVKNQTYPEPTDTRWWKWLLGVGGGGFSQSGIRRQTLHISIQKEPLGFFLIAAIILSQNGGVLRHVRCGTVELPPWVGAYWRVTDPGEGGAGKMNY